MNRLGTKIKNKKRGEKERRLLPSFPSSRPSLSVISEALAPRQGD